MPLWVEAALLTAYLIAYVSFCIRALYTYLPIAVFESQHPMLQVSADQSMMFLTLAAGGLGSFIHAAQSLGDFIGNRQLRWSWFYWYLLRLPLGSVIGFVFYIVLKAGLLGGTTSQGNVYGVVAVAAMAGWFSKNAADKMSEVFNTMFRTGVSGQQRSDPLESKYQIKKVQIILKDAQTFTVVIDGEGFEEGCLVYLNKIKQNKSILSKTQITFDTQANLFKPDEEVELRVLHPMDMTRNAAQTTFKWKAT